MGAEVALINFAKGELGYSETPVNITKYNQWADDNDYWFAKVQGCSWCTTFVAYCIEKSLKGASWELEDFCLDDKCCWSDQWMNNFKLAGRFWVINPRIGDFAFRKGHIGIVSGVTSDGTIYTIEGNYADSVMERKNPIKWWLGFGRPKWENVIMPPKVDPEDVQAKMWAINQGIYIGREDGEMHWKDSLTREEMAIILYRYWMKFNK